MMSIGSEGTAHSMSTILFRYKICWCGGWWNPHVERQRYQRVLEIFFATSYIVSFPHLYIFFTSSWYILQKKELIPGEKKELTFVHKCNSRILRIYVYPYLLTTLSSSFLPSKKKLPSSKKPFLSLKKTLQKDLKTQCIVKTRHRRKFNHISITQSRCKVRACN